MKYISLTRGKNAIVDDEDFEYLNQWKWQCNSKGYAVRTQHSYNCKQNPIKNCKPIFMHRLIMNTPQGMFTDHINGNPLDNQKSNLRVCTNTQNQMNKVKFGQCIYKGVHLHKNKKRFEARIQKDKKPISLGYFETTEEAAIAYNKAALRYFGEFAKLNDVVFERRRVHESI